ncbi:hypothetical protein ETB97_006226 [Aspergillus alliaceus]|uniref:Uncharacterized protein n=1 Tax=Petromyces alliaceus TaxID=209559 RepID=A0A8H6E2I7_PETAA|nr:hypothetical protein ETB97_006226 [Aspergillus burnettii]
MTGAIVTTCRHSEYDLRELTYQENPYRMANYNRHRRAIVPDVRIESHGRAAQIASAVESSAMKQSLNASDVECTAQRLRLCPAGTSLQWNGLLAFSAMTDNVSSLLQAELNDATPLLYGSGDSLGSLGLAMLSHFSQVVVSTHPPAFAPIKKVLREHTIQLALTEPCLLYSILAVASTHRAQLLPPDSKQSIIATRFRHKAARIYRHQLQLPISRENMDMLISSCILIGMFSFSAEASNPLDSWVFSDDPIAMNWLSVQCGLRCMIGLIDPWLDESIWNEAFQASSNYEFYDDHRMGREDLDPDLADLCDISDITTEETNPFHWPLRMLCPLLRMPRHKCGATRITNFMGRLHSDFVNLLTAKEPRALLILSYWLALMYTSVHDWWVDPRLSQEHFALNIRTATFKISWSPKKEKVRALIDWDGTSSMPWFLGNERYPSWLTRNWAPTDYGYRIEGSHADENSSEELSHHRCGYRGVKKAAIMEDNDHVGDNTTALSKRNLERHLLVLESLSIAADQPVNLPQVVQKLFNEISKQGKFPEDLELWEICFGLADDDLGDG